MSAIYSYRPLAEATKQRLARVPGDFSAVTRLVQTIGDFIGHDGLSLGVDAIGNLDCDNGDNGTYVIGDDWSISERRWTNDTRKTRDDLSDGECVSHDEIVSMLAKYAEQRISNSE